MQTPLYPQAERSESLSTSVETSIFKHNGSGKISADANNVTMQFKILHFHFCLNTLYN